MDQYHHQRVVQSKPPRVFDSSALRAIKKWKFKPKVVNGIAVLKMELK